MVNFVRCWGVTAEDSSVDNNYCQLRLFPENLSQLLSYAKKSIIAYRKIDLYLFDESNEKREIKYISKCKGMVKKKVFKL